MAGANANKIVQKGWGSKAEYTCAAQLSVGLVVEHASTADKIQVSSVATTIYRGGPMVVTEAPERGKGIYSSGTTENTYAIGEQVPTYAMQSGDEVLVLLLSGQSITRGGELEVDSAGKVKAAAGTNLPAFTALETLAPSQDALILAQRL